VSRSCVPSRKCPDFDARKALSRALAL
jgi:hypothetical protein